MSLLRFEHHAMNTLFEIWLSDHNPSYAEQAAQAAFSELERLENELSRYLPNSEISRINSLRNHESTTITPDTQGCLIDCMYLYNLTKGAFDISAGPLIDIWKNRGKKTDSIEHIRDFVEEKRTRIGLPWLHIDSDGYRVTKMGQDLLLDLGGYGKGYALRVMAATLREWDIDTAFVHGGHSTVLAVSGSTDVSWPVSIHLPGNRERFQQTLTLHNQALSGSGLVKGTHIIDPRSGSPVKNRVAAWVLSENPAHADALSTAFLIMDLNEVNSLCHREGNLGALIIENAVRDNEFTIHTFGMWPESKK